ncbi:hypothetical protein LTR94_027971, partial [Friedmanniomyces endolithicus]
AFLPETTAASYAAVGQPPAGLYAEARTGEPLALEASAQGLSHDGELLTPIGPGVWAMGADRLEFDASGALTRVTREGERLAYEHREGVAPATADLASLTGVFFSDEALSRLSVAQSAEGKLSIGRVGWPSTPLSPSYQDVFTGRIGMVSFERDAQGVVTALRINNGRAQNVRSSARRPDALRLRSLRETRPFLRRRRPRLNEATSPFGEDVFATLLVVVGQQTWADADGTAMHVLGRGRRRHVRAHRRNVFARQQALTFARQHIVQHKPCGVRMGGVTVDEGDPGDDDIIVLRTDEDDVRVGLGALSRKRFNDIVCEAVVAAFDAAHHPPR